MPLSEHFIPSPVAFKIRELKSLPHTHSDEGSSYTPIWDFLIAYASDVGKLLDGFRNEHLSVMRIALHVDRLPETPGQND